MRNINLNLQLPRALSKRLKTEAAALAEVTRLEKEKDKLAEGLKQAEQIVEEVSAYEKSLNENTVALAQDNEKHKSELHGCPRT